MNQRRSFTPQFKTQVVLEILTRLKSTAQVCREYELKEQVADFDVQITAHIRTTMEDCAW